MIKCLIGGNTIRVAGDAAGWAGSGKAEMRGNRKSRMALLRMADIDGYLTGEMSNT